MNLIQMKSHIDARFPGFCICLLIGVLAQWLAQFVPLTGAALLAIGIGLLAGNTYFQQKSLEKGTKFSESRLLEYSIVLTGMTLHISDIAGIGFRGIFYLFFQMTFTIVAAYLIGRWLKFGRRFSLLMCAGNAVCGSSAIGTIAPVIQADSKDKGISIAIVNVTGTVLMVLLPLITGLVYQNALLPTSGMIGGILQSIGQVIASAKLVNDEVVELSTIFKIVRILFLILVALVFSRIDTDESAPLFSRRQQIQEPYVDASNPKNSSQAQNCPRRVTIGIPWFIAGFFLCSIAASLHLIPDGISTGAKFISSQFEITALAAIGMRVKFSDLRKEGPKALFYGGMVGICQIICAMFLIHLLL